MAVARAKVGIGRIKPHMVGGDVQNVMPASVLLNSNESAFGPSRHAVAAARAAVTGIARYLENPDSVLAPAIARHFGLSAEKITVGQGSDDLLARLARAYLGAGLELIRSANGYLKVPNYAHATDADIVSVPDDDLTPSVDGMIAAITERTRIVYLANPENPAGTYLSGAEVRRLHAAMPKNALLVLDCAYAEYVDAPDYEPGHKLVEEAGNVVMCRTFSKIFGLAGARVGWLYGPDDVVDTVRRIGVTFPVAGPSAAAVVAALEDREHTKMVYRENKRGRGWLGAALGDLGLSVVPGQGNFLLVRFDDPARSAQAADRELRQGGIAVRRFASPAYDDYIRITIGHPGDLRATVNALSRFLAGEG